MELDLSVYDPYANGDVFVFADGTAIMERTPYTKDSFSGTYHIVKELDSLDKLAYQYYDGLVDNPARYWWLIADANDIENPLDLSNYIGKEIIIPNILEYNEEVI